MKTLDSIDDLYAQLSNLELDVVYDGGSARVLTLSPRGGDWQPAWVDLDGLYLDGDDPGYVRSVRGWKVDRYY
jgi:hypothetical protein